MRSGYRLISTLSLLAVAAGTLFLSLPAEAQLRRSTRATGHVPGSLGIPQPEPRINLSIKNRSLGRVLSEVFKQTPYKYEVKADVGAQLYSLEAKNTPLTVALRNVLAQDKQTVEPLVFAFHMSQTGAGVFTFHREYLEVAEVEGENRVSVANARVTTILPLVFKQMGAKYRIEPDVPPVLVSLQLRPQSWEQVLPQVMLEAYKQEPALTYSLDGDTYVVHLHKNPTTIAAYMPEGAKPIRKVKIALAQTPLREALTQLFQGSEWKFQVADSVRDVTVTYNTTTDPEFGALAAILKQAGSSGSPITYREGKGIVYIEPGPLPGQAVADAKGGINVDPITSLAVTQKPMRMIVKQLEAPLKVKIEVAPNIPDVPVTFTVVDGTIDEFLKAIIQSARASVPTLVFKMKEEGVYRLELGAAM